MLTNVRVKFNYDALHIGKARGILKNWSNVWNAWALFPVEKPRTREMWKNRQATFTSEHLKMTRSRSFGCRTGMSS